MSYLARHRLIEGSKTRIIEFRHPLLEDRDGRRGRKITRTIPKDAELEPNKIVENLNRLLSREDLHDLKFRPQVSHEFGPETEQLFFGPLEIDHLESPYSIAEHYLPLPKNALKVVIVGPIAGGKSTAVRKFLGFDDRDRIPSVGAGATSIAPFQVVIDPQISSPRAFIVLQSESRVRRNIEENISQALEKYIAKRFEAVRSLEVEKAALKEKAFEAAKASFKLDEQRQFPLEYILSEEFDADIYEHLRDLCESAFEVQLGIVNRKYGDKSKTPLDDETASFVDALKEARLGDLVLSADETERTGRCIDLFVALSSNALERIRKKIMSTVPETPGAPRDTIRRRISKSGWLEAVEIVDPERSGFYKKLYAFIGIDREQFGSLLTPVVDFIRLLKDSSNTFFKEIGSERSFAFLDLQGIGHGKTDSLDPKLIETILGQDEVLFVTGSQGGLQSAGTAVLKLVANSEMSERLRICFTRFEETLSDDRLGSDESARRAHVFAHVRSSIATLIESPVTQVSVERGRALERHLEKATYYLEDMNRSWSVSQRNVPELTMSELRKLAEDLNGAPVASSGTTGGMAGSAGSVAATSSGHQSSGHNAGYKNSQNGQAQYGIGINNINSKIEREFHRAISSYLNQQSIIFHNRHWTQVRALTRRITERTSMSYEDINPIGDLHAALLTAARRVVDQAVNQAVDQPDLKKQIDWRSVSFKLLKSSIEILHDKPHYRWRMAYRESGSGSGGRRRDQVIAILSEALEVTDEFRLNVAPPV